MGSYGEYDKKELKKLQNVLIEMLKDVNYICDKYNIKYFALDGTGIGAMRHKGFIPWDDDIDLRILEKDIPKFRKCVEKEMSDKNFALKFSSELEITFLFSSNKIDSFSE